MIGIDIRPTQITIALADVNGRFLAQEVFPTPGSVQLAVEEMIGRVQRIVSLCSSKTIDSIGVSIPGRVHPGTGSLTFVPNLKWAGEDLVTPLQAATGLPVVLENAANACVLASLWFDQGAYDSATPDDFGW